MIKQKVQRVLRNTRSRTQRQTTCLREKRSQAKKEYLETNRPVYTDEEPESERPNKKKEK